jgi:hypothetical protein
MTTADAAYEHVRLGVKCARGGRRKIGLVWADKSSNRNDRNRSIRLTQFAPLAGIPGAWQPVIERMAEALRQEGRKD